MRGPFHAPAIGVRMDALETGITEILKEELGKIQAAVERFAETKADKADLEAVQADVAELQRAAGK